MNLLTIKKGNEACIMDLTNVSPTIKQRLLHMGVCEGCHVKLQQVLPFGGPCVFECAGQTIGIRRAEAKDIMVKPL